MLDNSYVRKLVWGLGFAVFCFAIGRLYKYLLCKKNKVVINSRFGKYSLFSLADACIFLILTVLAAIRLNTGSDYYNYYIRFNAISGSPQDIKKYFLKMDGYSLLSCIIKHFTDNKYAIFGVIAVILYGYLFFVINKESEDKAMSLVCYLYLGFFANSLNILKQCIAMVFVLCFYRAMKDKRFGRAILFAVLAVVFHYSVIFILGCILCLTVVKVEPSERLLRFSVISGVCAALFLPTIVTIFIRIIPSASGYLVYVDWRRNNQIRLVIAVLGMSLMYFILCSYLVKNREVIKKVSEARYFEIVLLIIGLCINIASVRIWIVQRISVYFYQFIILILPAMFKGLELEGKNVARIKRNIMIMMFVYLIFCGIFLGENEYYSYHTIFSGGEPIYDVDYNKMFR